MKLFFLYFSLVLLFSTSLISCKKTRPQLPSNKKASSQIDQKKELEEINKTLIVREDSLLKIYTATLSRNYERHKLGFWHTSIEKKTEKRNLKPNDKCRIKYQTFLLNGNLVEDENEISITVGRKEIMNGIDFALELLQKGDSIELIVPWYLAYGTLGKTDLIPPYSSIRCKLKVLEEL